VAVDPVLKLARILDPGVDPASITYRVGAQPDAGAVQDNETAEPLTEEVRPDGSFGAPAQGPATMTTTSFDAALEPAELRARTRTTYVPDGTPVAVNDVAVLRVSNTTMLAAPADEPASIT
jgi:hypothetical protein